MCVCVCVCVSVCVCVCVCVCVEYTRFPAYTALIYIIPCVFSDVYINFK